MGLKTAIDKILPQSVRDLLHICYHNCVILINRLRWKLSGRRVGDPKDIPIIINNYNRLTYLKALIGSLKERGYNNIHILDNKSTYPPLLEYYKNTPCRVIRLNENIGYKALWESGVFDEFKHSYYVYTDSDMELSADCPDDFMYHFITILEKYTLSQKVGFGIKIDDLPDHFINKTSVIEHESEFWRDEIESGLYRAPIDTTFALYRPYCKGVASRYHKVFRTGEPYTIRHLPWYVDSANMSDEELYYVNNISQSTHWSQQSKV